MNKRNKWSEVMKWATYPQSKKLLWGWNAWNSFVFPSVFEVWKILRIGSYQISDGTSSGEIRFNVAYLGPGCSRFCPQGQWGHFQGLDEPWTLSDFSQWWVLTWSLAYWELSLFRPIGGQLWPWSCKLWGWLSQRFSTKHIDFLHPMFCRISCSTTLVLKKCSEAQFWEN